MKGRISIIKEVSTIENGRRKKEEFQHYSCWCEIKSLSTTEKYTALQAGMENVIVFKVRSCKKVEEIRLELKKFYAEFKGTKLKIYDASPMVTEPEWTLLRCRTME